MQETNVWIEFKGLAEALAREMLSVLRLQEEVES